MSWSNNHRTTRVVSVAVDDICENLVNAHYMQNPKSFGLMLRTNYELYFLEHWNKCIRRVTYETETGMLMTTDTTNLTDKDYDRILCKVEDTIGMSVDELSGGRIFYKR